MEESYFNGSQEHMSFNETANVLDRRVYPDALLFAYNSFLILVITFGVLGNLLVLIMFVKFKLCSSTDWFILFITVFDFISSFANVPVYLTFTTGTWQYYGSDNMCKIHMYVSQVVVTTSAVLTGGLAVERYLLICRLHSTMSKRKALHICLVICVMTTVFSIPTPLLHKNVNGICKTGHLGCLPFIYFLAVFVVFITVFVVVVVCYTKICTAIAKSRDQISAHGLPHKKDESVKTSNRETHPRIKLNRIYPINVTATMTQSTDIGNIDGTIRENNELMEENRAATKHQLVKSDKALNQAPNPSLKVFNVQTVNSKHNDALQANGVGSQKLRTTKIAFLVCFIFVLSWVSPLLFYILLSTMKHTKMLLRFALFGRMTYLLSTFANPFLYVWLNSKFRSKLKEHFHLRL